MHPLLVIHTLRQLHGHAEWRLTDNASSIII